MVSSRETAAVDAVSPRPARYLLRGDVAVWARRERPCIFFDIWVVFLVFGHLWGE
jgi:hypothetical protein